jgi:hypothetical protein
MTKHEEYLRRNLVVAKACGASAAIESALARLINQKRSPKWLQEKLRAAQSRLLAVPHELARWRDSSEDAP